MRNTETCTLHISALNGPTPQEEVKGKLRNRPPRLPLRGKQLEIACELQAPQGYQKAKSILDSGADGEAFIDSSYVREHKIPTYALYQEVNVAFADGKRGDPITHIALLYARHNKEHYSEVACYVTNLGRTVDIIFGTPWWQQHCPTINWEAGTLSFPDPRCAAGCLRKIPQPESYLPGANDRIRHVSATAFLHYLKSDGYTVGVLLPGDFEALDRPESQDKEWAAKQLCSDLRLAGIARDDFEKFFKKLNRPPMSKEELEKLIPKTYQAFLGRFEIGRAHV